MSQRNQLLTETRQTSFAKMSQGDNRDKYIQIQVTIIKDHFRGIGEQGALELLQALGLCLRGGKKYTIEEKAKLLRMIPE